MFTTMLDLKVASATERSVKLIITDLKNPVELVIRPYERGVVVEIPWAFHERLGFPTYEALKSILRQHYGHVETRTASDPAFAQAAIARGERQLTNRTSESVYVY